MARRLLRMKFQDTEVHIEESLGRDLVPVFGSDVEGQWITPADMQSASGIVSPHLITSSGVVWLDQSRHIK